MKIEKVLPYILVGAAIIGLLASYVLTYDKIQVLMNPAYDPPCNINPVLSCGSVMKTSQASLMGVPNTIFGLGAFSALLTFGVLLASGATFKRWVWLAAQGAATLGAVFMHYLFFQGVFVIGAICPWCFAVWMVTIPVFWYITVYNLQSGVFGLRGRALAVSKFIVRHHGDILGVWYLAIFGIILWRFWYYWSSLL